ncbi:MAG: SPFH domain-containing protein [Candidatus Sumerlaeia bacterium]|nr:SPFH domain-containing protein [Candidatus Sumerlaeia bacterium]
MSQASQERVIQPASGWGMLGLTILLYVFTAAGLVWSISNENVPGLIFTVVALLGAVLLSCGFFMLQPNQAAVLLLFGAYQGTARSSGFWWVNPFYWKKKLSLRLHNLAGERLKVNDKTGNPIEIAAIVVWRVADTYAASFDVDNYMSYVETQGESALRHLATQYPYDAWEDETAVSLRANIDEVSHALERELQDRLSKAGVVVEEARLSHLAYAPEIAESMLKRQQAGAIIAARKKIVEGAVGMVQMALEHLKHDQIVELDEERKASMVSNLLVILCGETHAQPVVNTGTLYAG